MTARYRYQPGARVSQVLSRSETVDRRWTFKAPEPLGLTRSQEIALLTLRNSDHGTQVLKALFAAGAARACEADFAALVPHGLASVGWQGCHAITPRGHYPAACLARDLAAEIGLRLVNYRSSYRSGFRRVAGMSNAGNA